MTINGKFFRWELKRWYNFYKNKMKYWKYLPDGISDNMKIA